MQPVTVTTYAPDCENCEEETATVKCQCGKIYGRYCQMGLLNKCINCEQKIN